MDDAAGLAACNRSDAMLHRATSDPLLEPITLDELAKALVALEWAARDPEWAHIMEDHIRDAVLRAVAHGVPYARELALRALDTKAIAFPRWYA